MIGDGNGGGRDNGDSDYRAVKLVEVSGPSTGSIWGGENDVGGHISGSGTSF